MATVIKERVTSVHHWNDNLFSFKTTRAPDLRFESGHFVMMGLEVEGKPLMRAYSIASANYEPELEFFSIKVANGPLTSRLQNIAVGDEVLVSTKPTGTLVADHLLAGRHLYLISTGTGLAPFMSIIRDPSVYERFDKIILTHGVRSVSELAYQDVILKDLPQHEYLGELVQEQLIYYPTVTREPYHNQGRLTDSMKSGQLNRAINLPDICPENDRFMICGSPSMLKDTCHWLDGEGFIESRHGHQGHYVVERAFVEK
ncbi:MAG: ferredoxin--NADP reductase [Gammaproteobacteria bacterium]|uniref:ferredoxin--NADP reductase n=1 Tax=Pseudomaricurvus alcaniphilus TaxID=1166482 RepID=UPI0014077B51|nr:ferredoxin--NADP reductase [Pseudomaricurvus alcaniphilus]MBR9911865.1 ferredoxin--NADP reductase [Gammaproteobacteria bacterium]NHN36084.1 ferredoxin--NADP reductase [Pseudomaricurvus alcaniphilus]